MYSRSNQHWLYLYYSGEHLKDIASYLGLSRNAVTSRISYMRLPCRPNHFHGDYKIDWLKAPHVVALRKLFEGK